MKLILASSSASRFKLLQRLCVPFSVVPPHIDETALPDEMAEAVATRLALQKAQAVAAQVDEGLIIGSDQVIVVHGQQIGKPLTHENAVAQLKLMSGSTCLALTGLCLLNASTGEYQLTMVPFSVDIRPLTDRMIENYLQMEQPYHCAGSIKSEGLGISLFERMEGEDPTALEGLPLIALTRMLENAGFSII
jgi:septum formation protein